MTSFTQRSQVVRPESAQGTLQFAPFKNLTLPDPKQSRSPWDRQKLDAESEAMTEGRIPKRNPDRKGESA